jgi:hypothetical protein
MEGVSCPTKKGASCTNSVSSFAMTLFVAFIHQFGVWLGHDLNKGVSYTNLVSSLAMILFVGLIYQFGV